jgi:hypothetical protein
MTNNLKNSSKLSHLKPVESPKLESLDSIEKSKFSQNTSNNNNSYFKNDTFESCVYNADMSNGTNNFLRAFILFILGSFFSLVLNILQMEYKSNLFPSNVLSFFQTIWWAIPTCGLAAGRNIIYNYHIIRF